MISNFAKSMGMAPIPLAWGELLEGLKSGLVDATETYPELPRGSVCIRSCLRILTFSFVQAIR